jgi:hypothetical protein
MADDDLVTAAVFGDQTAAVAARIYLEDAGIPAFLQDELMSSGLFEAGAAIGGIKLEVPASRLEEAVRLINDRMPAEAAAVNWSDVDVGQPEEEAVEDEEPPPEPRPEPSPTPAEPIVETGPRDLTLREQRADRIVRGAVMGIVFWPALVLAGWRLMQIANSEERLRPEYQRKANLGAILVGVPLLLMLVFCCGVTVAQFRS